MNKALAKAAPWIFFSAWMGASANPGPVAVDSALAGMESSLGRVESKVLSTLMFGGSSPVSFSGEARLKIQDHNFTDYPPFLTDNQTWTAANWEGNESFLRLGMVVRPNRNTVLWSKIGFQHTLPGNYLNPQQARMGPDGFTPIQTRHDKSEETANIHEDMSAGIALRTIPASFWLRMGNVLWTEASPLTIWKAQPRTFAWDYLPFEVEQPIARYYEYNVAKGEKSGRAAWNKKPFNGVNLESINLPADLYFNFLYAGFERYDNFEREFIDWSNDLGYAGLGTEAKGRGIGDSYRRAIHGRVAHAKTVGGLSLGVNYAGTRYQPSIVNQTLWRVNFGLRDTLVIDPVSGASSRVPLGNGFYKHANVLSLDLRGSIGDNWLLQSDLALSRLDTIWHDWTLAGHASRTESRDIIPAAYAKVTNLHFFPVEADFAYFPKGFYSPFSFAAPIDAFMPFGANMVGSGKFMARGEGSPYVQNMAGLKLTLTPYSGFGHFKVSYGQHFQPEASRDILFFPHRLNGADLSSVFQTSYNRWGNNLVDHSLPVKYNKRLGDESFRVKEYLDPLGPEAGGLRNDYLTLYEGFVPYQSVAQAQGNIGETTGIFTRSNFVPVNKKWTSNFEVDAAYDVGPLIGYKRDLFMSGYFSLNGVTTSPAALSLDESGDDMLLWGAYLRFEPAMALTDNLYILALAGYENWRSQKAYAMGLMGVEHMPIDFRDYAYGVGFDWDIAPRVGLHGRYKWMQHDDVNLPVNNWKARVMSAEIKTWF